MSTAVDAHSIPAKQRWHCKTIKECTDENIESFEGNTITQIFFCLTVVSLRLSGSVCSK